MGQAGRAVPSHRCAAETGQETGTEMIHATAIVTDSAVIADDVEIGAYSVIGDSVEIGSGTRIDSHVVVNGPTKIGKDNHIYQFASIGDDPQDKKYADEPTRLIIGDRIPFANSAL